MPVSIHPKTQEAIDLFLNGADCLSRASQFGFKIDLDKLSESKLECKKVLDSIESEIREIDLGIVFVSSKALISISTIQISTLLTKQKQYQDLS